MGKKLSQLGFNAQRTDIETIDPEELSLVWHKKTAEFGPRDFLLKDHPELEWAFDPTIQDPFNEAYVSTCMTKTKTGYVGILQAITFRKVEIGGQLFLIVIMGRGRTRVCREANRRIRVGGGDKTDIIYIKAQLKDTDDEMAAVMRDIENTHRKPITPLMIARLAQHHIEKGTPEHLIAKACGVGTFAQVKNYLQLLEQPEPVQRMVDAGQIPMSAKVEDVQAVVEAVEQRGKLTGKEIAEIQGAPKPKPMGKKEIARWMAKLPSDKNGAIVRAVLETVQGIGTMSAYPHLSPGESS